MDPGWDPSRYPFWPSDSLLHQKQPHSHRQYIHSIGTFKVRRCALPMLLPGRSVIPKIIGNVRSAKIQAQPCGVDLTLKRVKTWTSPGSVDFDNSLRLNASTTGVPFIRQHEQFQNLPAQFRLALSSDPATLEKLMHGRQESIMLEQGAYLVEFNKTVDTPSSLMGQIFVRSSLFRSGALLSAGVMDSGYKGAMGAMLRVVNPHGLPLFRDARLAQMAFHQMSEPVEGYSGVYQGSGSVWGPSRYMIFELLLCAHQQSQHACTACSADRSSPTYRNIRYKDSDMRATIASLHIIPTSEQCIISVSIGQRNGPRYLESRRPTASCP